jgi:aryl-alcohol dehydrogenase-like predicted oxidoreductase
VAAVWVDVGERHEQGAPQSFRERSLIAMKQISIGGLEVSRIGLGAMSMSGYYNTGEGSDAESIRAIHRALDLGVTHLDTAEIYGPYVTARESAP